MRRIFLKAAVAMIAALAAAPAAAAPTKAAPKFAAAEDVLKWINGYRQNPEPKRLPDAVRFMGEVGVFKDLDSAGVYIGFVAGVIGSNPDKAEDLVTKMFPMPPEDQVVLIRAIAYSGLPDWKELLKKFVERMPARKVLIERYLFGKAQTLAELPLDTGATTIDTHWGYYFATGSPEPVKRIVSALEWSTERNNVERLTIGSMAKWTLAQNAARDLDLLAILKAELSEQPKEMRVPLREVVDAAETFEISRIRKDALKSIEDLKTKGPEANRNFAWWGQAGQTVLALGCVAAGAMGQVAVGIPCVIGGAASTAALKYLAPTTP